CVCENYKLTTNCSVNAHGQCQCTSIGTQHSIICTKLASKCLVMKAEMSGSKAGRRVKPEGAIQNNDGLYDPECDDKGLFKAKQCNGTSTCWCVNTAGVRRTDKDSEISCSETVRTFWIIIELKHKTREKPYDVQSLQAALKEVITSRYQLDPKYITNILYENDVIIIDLVQNSSQKTQNDVDIADVAYYFEKDGLQAGIIAVIVVVAVAVTAGIAVLVSIGQVQFHFRVSSLKKRKKRMAKYEKAEIKEMGEMHRERNA
ncbi:Epithelial cell adhesion molecule, partial [Eschrichtius robustus]|nr:Epithelial cell adhesion molecule [Eschrichtius robustus]